MKHKALIRIIIAIIAIIWLSYTLVKADSEPVDPITTLNNQINEIDKKLMVNSQIYNSSEQIIITERQKQEKANKENEALRIEKAKLIAEKEAKIVWK